MSKMGRLLRGELNKILMRPILYVFTGIIVLALVFSATLMSMENRGSDYKIEGSTKTEIMTNFSTAKGMNKSIAENNVSSAFEKLNYYKNLSENAENTVTAQLKLLVGDGTDTKPGAQRLLNNYVSEIIYLQSQGETTASATLKSKRNDLISVLNEAKSLISDATKSTSPSVIMPKTRFDEYIQLISDSLFYLTAEADYNLLATHEKVYQDLSKANGYGNIEGITYFDKLKYLTYHYIEDIALSKESIESLEKQYTNTTEFLASTLTNINKYSTEETATTGQLKAEILKYYYMASQFNQLVTDTIYYEPVKGLNDSSAHNYIGYEKVSLYQVHERITKNTYLISNGKTVNEYSSVFTPTKSSGDKVGAFDLVYFGLEICSFIILIFCVVLAAGMIAGEQSNGTLKVLATRPFSRSKILTSKILATLIFGIIFMIFSTLVLFITGFAIYGLDMTPILAVFNASSAFVISPILLLVIYIALMIVKILFYVLLATMISTVFRSNVGAVAISIFIYFLTALFAVLFTSSGWYAFIPFAGIDLFKFFGGAFASDINNPLSIAFSSPMFYNSSFIVSIVMVVASMAIMTILSYTVFKKREIK